LPAQLAVLPLQTSLQLSFFPPSPAIGPEMTACQPYRDPSGNTSNGFAVRPLTSFSLTPRLTLHGFSNLDCPTYGTFGGGVTYTAPIASKLWVVAGAGVYGLPAALPSPAAVHTDVRVDIVKQLDDNRSWSVGFGKVMEGYGFAFGSRW
jgi:hypothetical protein